MTYSEKTVVTTAKLEIYLGNAGSDDARNRTVQRRGDWRCEKGDSPYGQMIDKIQVWANRGASMSEQLIFSLATLLQHRPLACRDRALKARNMYTRDHGRRRLFFRGMECTQ